VSSSGDPETEQAVFYSLGVAHVLVLYIAYSRSYLAMNLPLPLDQLLLPLVQMLLLHRINLFYWKRVSCLSVLAIRYDILANVQLIAMKSFDLAFGLVHIQQHQGFVNLHSSLRHIGSTHPCFLIAAVIFVLFGFEISLYLHFFSRISSLVTCSYWTICQPDFSMLLTLI
jgi:hypothetical protein